MKHKVFKSLVYTLSLFALSNCKEKQLAPASGARISTEQVSALTKSLEKSPKKEPLKAEELEKVILKEPYNISEKDPKPLTAKEFAKLPEETRQAIAVLINRGILEWDSESDSTDNPPSDGLLYDYNGTPTSAGMISDFINRYKILSEQKDLLDNINEDEFDDENEDKESTSDSSQSKKSSLLTIENAGIAVSLIGSLGTFMWGYREYKLHSTEINKTLSMSKELNKVTSPTNIPSGLRKDLLARGHKVPTNAAELKSLKDSLSTKKVGGSLFDFNSTRNGKFIYAPVLFATALGTLGIAAYSINQKMKD